MNDSRAGTSLALPAPGDTAPPSVLLPAADSVVCVQLGDALFGFPIEEVREVLPTPPITPVPFTPAHVAGVASVRGVIVPVVDLGLRLLHQPAVRPGRMVVVNVAGIEGPVGVLVDSVPGLIGAEPASIREPPPEAEAALPAGWVAGVLAPTLDRLVTLLHLVWVLAPDDLADKEHR